MKRRIGGKLDNYFEKSFSAYKLVNEVSKSLEIDEPPEISVFNGNVSKIISRCIQIIDANYSEKKTRELLKYYVAHSFFQDYDLENDEDYEDYEIN